MFINTTSENGIMNTFNSIINSKSCDADGFQMESLNFALTFSVQYSHICIFNIPLSSGVFPKEMQKAKVTVIFKGADQKI